MSVPGRIRGHVAGCLIGAALGGAVMAADRVEPAAQGTVRVDLDSAIPPGAIVVAQARAATRERWLPCYGQVIAGPRATVDVNAYNSGQVRRLFVRPGDRISKGDALLTIYSPEFISTQRGHLALFQNKQKLEVLREEGRLPNYLKDAEENLRWWGMSPEQIDELMHDGKLVEEITLRSPADGVVTEIFVQPGSVINAGDRTMNAFLVAGKSVARIVSRDSAYWVEASVYPDQLDSIAAGAPVRIRLDDGSLLQRRVTLVSPTVDLGSQRARFVVDLEQPVGGLPLGRAVEMSVRTKAAAGVWVPRDAVLGQSVSPAVYVQIGAARFERRPVLVLGEAADALQVAGVDDGEKVVSSGKMILEGARRMSGVSGGSGGAPPDGHAR